MQKINIDGKYPCMGNWVTLRKVDERIIARNCLIDEDIELTSIEAQYLVKLNGNRNPNRINGYSQAECYNLYNYLDNLLLIRESGRKLDLGMTKLLTIYIPRKKRSSSVVPKLLNFMLMISFLPILVLGVIRLTNEGVYLGGGHVIIGYLGGLFWGMVLHELAHAVSCLSYGGSWLETGVMWSGMLPGAYVLIDESRVKGRLQKVQINLAGVEMNLLLSGIMLLLISQTQWYSYGLSEWTEALFQGALQNIFLAIINLTFAEGLDGEHSISLLIGKGSIVDNAKANIKMLFNCKSRKLYFKDRGINGAANMCASITVMMFQMIVPLIILSNIGALVALIGGIFL